MNLDRKPPPAPVVAAPWRQVALRMLVRVAVLAAVVMAVHLLMNWLDGRTHTIGQPQMLDLVVIAALLAVYALLIATPFVPGIEIGIALMLMQGGAVAPFVYLSTVAGLLLAFLAGRLLPYAALHRLLADLRLHPACRLIERVAPLPPHRRLDLLRDKLPSWLGARAIRHRYVLLGILLNLPGNGVVGGGGGLALMSGFSRLYAPAVTALTLAIAVAPVPFLVWWFDGPVLPLPG